MQTTQVTNLFFAGVGGQGLVLANTLTGLAAREAGLDVKSSDIYGLAMRGGSVYGFHRHGPSVYSSTFPAGQGHILVALEPLEGLRWAKMMRKGAKVLLNTRPVFPSPVLLEKEKYPTEIKTQLEQAGLDVEALDALTMARQAGSEKVVNSVLLGALSRFLPLIPGDAWDRAFRIQFSQERLEMNWKAFLAGQGAVS